MNNFVPGKGDHTTIFREVGKGESNNILANKISLKTGSISFALVMDEIEIPNLRELDKSISPACI